MDRPESLLDSVEQRIFEATEVDHAAGHRSSAPNSGPLNFDWAKIRQDRRRVCTGATGKSTKKASELGSFRL
jgi:hypothetical protein